MLEVTNFMNRKEEILGLVRHALTFAGGFAVSADLLDNTNADVAVGAIVSLITVVWSVVEKIKTRALIQGLTVEK